MKKQPIHQNLNTSFVNVGALVRYLRGLQFVGSIRIELSSYDADIVFTSSKTIQAREYDHIAGRISQGEHALKRILIRAREPHGRIHVYKAVEGYAGQDDGSVFVDKSIVTQARELAASHGGTIVYQTGQEIVLSSQDTENALVLAALSDLLRVIDETLAKGKLSFAAAFRVACDEISSEFPFLQQRQGALVYRDGEIFLRANADAKLVACAVFAALKPIFKRLRGDNKYSALLQMMSERLFELSTEKSREFVSLGLMNSVEQLLAGGE